MRFGGRLEVQTWIEAARKDHSLQTIPGYKKHCRAMAVFLEGGGQKTDTKYVMWRLQKFVARYVMRMVTEKIDKEGGEEENEGRGGRQEAVAAVNGGQQENDKEKGPTGELPIQDESKYVFKWSPTWLKYEADLKRLYLDGLALDKKKSSRKLCLEYKYWTQDYMPKVDFFVVLYCFLAIKGVKKKKKQKKNRNVSIRFERKSFSWTEKCRRQEDRLPTSTPTRPGKHWTSSR